MKPGTPDRFGSTGPSAPPDYRLTGLHDSIGAPLREGPMSFRRAVSVLLLAAYLPACTSFQSTSQPLTELTAPPKPVNKVRVTTTAGRAIEVDAPRVVNDTLFGSTWTAGSGGKAGAQAVALPLVDIRTVEVRKSDSGSTVILVVAIVGGVVLLAVAGNAWTSSTLESAFEQ
jgi:hypothetical protein